MCTRHGFTQPDRPTGRRSRFRHSIPPAWAEGRRCGVKRAERTRNINTTTQQVRQTFDASLGPDDQGVDTATNIRQSVSNLNQATENMAEDTEVMKHNFFFRGFFKHRGYYSLSHLTPGEYRRNKLFSDSRNHRDWLQAGDLFQQDSNGLETLSPDGKARIDGAIAQLSGSRGAASLIIEGYSATQSPAEQLAASRNRAILVRDHIRRRFHLYAQDVVIESMGNRPTARLDKDRWDGIFIVPLHADSR